MKFSIRILSAGLFLVMPFFAKSQVGNPAPDFTVTDTDGQTHTLYDYLEAGKVVVLDFYFTTCGPCQFYSPQVNLAYEKYGCNTANVVFMAIDYDDTDAQVQAYDQQFNIQYPSVSGKNGGGNGVVSQYGIVGFPTFYVIDSTKKIIEKIDPPTLQVFDYRFQQHGILPADCNSSAIPEMTTTATNRLEIFPNPVGSERLLQVRLPELVGGPARFEILNFMGQTIQNGQLDLNPNLLTELQIDGLSAGAFLLKITSLTSQKIFASLFVVE